jgi:ATP-dependent RNA helicase UAP56/SUB2
LRKLLSHYYPQRYGTGGKVVKVSAVQGFPEAYFGCKNLFGRGMDIERAKILFNYEMQEDSDSYLHTVARAGRFATNGLAITLVSDDGDANILNEVQQRIVVKITQLPDEIHLSSYIEGRQ